MKLHKSRENNQSKAAVMSNYQRAFGMSKTLCTLSSLILFWTANVGFAQDEEIPKFDATFQLSFLNLNASLGEYPIGIGGRFGYRFSSLLYLDGEALYFPENPSGNFGETLVSGGIRSGMEFYSVGIFGKARAGTIHLGGRQFVSRMNFLTHPAIDLGVIFEYFHSRNFFMRMDLSDCIIPFGEISYLGVNGPENLKTTHNFWLDFGIGIRF
jgi:hypothetical protein